MQQFFERCPGSAKAQKLKPKYSLNPSSYRATKEGIMILRCLPQLHGKPIPLP
jgi:ornithine carbamoyltransferase